LRPPWQKHHKVVQLRRRRRSQFAGRRSAAGAWVGSTAEIGWPAHLKPTTETGQWPRIPQD
jgi:hypothetical protein